MQRLHRPAFFAVILLLLLALVAPVDAQSSKSERERRDSARNKRAQLARELNALRASDQQLEAAVAALDAQVQAEASSAAAARQAVQAAQARVAEAEARLAETENRIEDLKSAVVNRAVETYMRPEDNVAAGLEGARSMAEASRRSLLLDQVISHDQDLIDQLRAAREDLGIERAEADEARSVAKQRQDQVEARLAAVRAARAEQARLAAALDARIRQYAAEADAVAKEESRLTELIASRETAARASRSNAGLSEPGPASAAGLIWPVRGPVTSGYGTRWGRMHNGIDIGAGTGTPIRAAKAGTVIFAGTMGGYGQTIVIDHGGGFTTLYAHQSRLGSNDGQNVGQGTVIGYVGSTGSSTGPHLHFETRVNGSPQNPRRYLP